MNLCARDGDNKGTIRPVGKFESTIGENNVRLKITLSFFNHFRPQKGLSTKPAADVKGRSS
jgi:hypothetical protein